MVIELDNRNMLHILAACIMLLLAPLSLACQVAGTDSAGARNSADSTHWRTGIQLRSVQFDIAIYPTEISRALSTDIDILISSSRPPYSFGIRAGGELVGSMGMDDYSYEMIIGNLLGRMAVVKPEKVKLKKWS